MGESCFELNLLKDAESQLITVKIEAQTSQDPNTLHNITVKTEDVDFDLNQETLEEIWGTEDESNNNLGDTTVPSATIYIAD